MEMERDKTEGGSKQYFDSIAGDWDQIRSQFFQVSLRERLIARAQVEPGESAADIGAGSGFITEGLLRTGIKVIAVDQSPGMLDVISNKFKGLGTLEVRVGDAYKLPIETGAMDYVFANMYLHHVEQPWLAIEEMARILKPGGKVLISDEDEHQHEYLRIEQHDVWLGFRREDIRRWFADAGLTEVDVTCAGERCTSASEDGTEKTDISIFMAFGTKP